MAFRVFRRKNILSGVRLNFSKTGVVPSFGMPGAGATLGRRGLSGRKGGNG